MTQMNTDKIKKFFESLYSAVFHKGKTDMAPFDRIVYLLQFILLIILVVFAWAI
jgi:hypothetical protein